jgi:hypothetical protein
MTAEEKAQEIVRKHCDARGSFLKQDEENLVRLISEALHPAPPSEEEIEKARILWAEGVGRMAGLPENMIQNQKALVGKHCWNAAVEWALKRNRGE